MICSVSGHVRRVVARAMTMSSSSSSAAAAAEGRAARTRRLVLVVVEVAGSEESDGNQVEAWGILGASSPGC